ncbi:hypothetical protein DBV15_00113 [Temnothorax longispinosus]|uniref:Uncharacterized protein n=1 Tax=Temnothorax longispinosus TaxID=300112 RepID=A0A4S2KDE4_9HYME|nr:hypothetical protein DBV15_00113 [Temnothorax longispinosus]
MLVISQTTPEGNDVPEGEVYESPKSRARLDKKHPAGPRKTRAERLVADISGARIKQESLIMRIKGAGRNREALKPACTCRASALSSSPSKSNSSRNNHLGLELLERGRGLADSVVIRTFCGEHLVNRAIARGARARAELEQGRVRAGQRDSDAPSYGATLSALPTARLLITSLPSCASLPATVTSFAIYDRRQKGWKKDYGFCGTGLAGEKVGRKGEGQAGRIGYHPEGCESLVLGSLRHFFFLPFPIFFFSIAAYPSHPTLSSLYSSL